MAGSNLLFAAALAFATSAFAQAPAPRPPAPLIQGGPTIPPSISEAQNAYAECVRRKQAEMVLYGQAQQVRDLIDHRERFVEVLRLNPEKAKQYPGGVDQVIAEAFRHYRAAGGTAATPQAVQPGEPPCAPPIIVPPGPRGARALQPAPAVREAELRLENCVVRNRAVAKVPGAEDPCRDERKQLDAAVRAAYSSDSSPISQSRSMAVSPPVR